MKIYTRPLPRSIHRHMVPPSNISTCDRRHIMGHYCEELAAALYRMARFEILGQRHRISGVEIDLIARRGDCVHFVEIKYRQTIIEASRALTARQAGRIAQAAQLYVISEALRCIQIDLILFDRQLNWQRIDNMDVTRHRN